MRKFVCSVAYDLSPDTSSGARRLLRAQLVGRRWRDFCRDSPMPHNALWVEKTAGDKDTTREVHDACARDVKDALAAVAKAGLPIELLRAWIQVSGGGTFGMMKQ